MARTMFFVSDGTGITAETFGHSLLTQFDAPEMHQLRIPFVDSVEKAEQVVKRINRQVQQDGERAIVVATVVDAEIRDVLARAEALSLDVFTTYVEWLEKELGLQRKPRVGQAHGMVDFQSYQSRIDATNYALGYDDGLGTDYEDADVILVGVSRTGKTPTCLYLALQYGVKAANYPLTGEEFESRRLPDMLGPYRGKLFGLTIDPLRLSQIREARRPGSRYSGLEQCRFEVTSAENIFKSSALPFLNTTQTSIEEIASKVLLTLGLEKRLL